MAGPYSFSIDKGADFIRTFTWKDGTGSPVNLTGWSAQMILRRATDTTNRVSDTFTSDDDEIILGGSAGTYQINISSARTKKLEGEYDYYLDMISASGFVRRLMAGKITVNV